MNNDQAPLKRHQSLRACAGDRTYRARRRVARERL